MALFDLRPKLGRNLGKSGERFLFVCFFDPSGISTIYENIALWQQFSRYNIEILNLWPGGRNRNNLFIPSSVDLDDYDGVVIHCTVSYSPDNLKALDIELSRPFEDYDGLKILMKQDEQVHVNSFSEYIRQKGFDLVITCVPPEEREKVYPRNIVGDVAFLQALTGYVSPYMREIGFVDTADRPVGISYRGSIQPLEFGRLGFEKRKIGYDFTAALNGAEGLKVDISSRWEDRILGTAWFDFLASSKAVLGVESGSNLFDFTGEVADWCRQYEAAHPEANLHSEKFYLDAREEYLYQFEENVNYAQISPRHFEAAATHTAQVLYEGGYSGIFMPYKHFLPLRRDMSNFDEVIDFIHDDKRLCEFASCAFEEIILNPIFHYEHFVTLFDSAVETALQKKGRRDSHRRRESTKLPDAVRGRAIFLIGHEPTLDPRIEWVASGLETNFDVCEIGTYRYNVDGLGPSFESISPSRTRVRIERTRHDWSWMVPMGDFRNSGSIGIQVLNRLYLLAELPSKALARVIGALDATEVDLNRFQSYCQHYVQTSGSLLQAGLLIGEADLIVAADLETLPAAIALAESFNALVLYDAHEYWPHSDSTFRHWEMQLWGEVERTLANCADIRLAVSSPLADLMSRDYGCKFLSVPNCVPVSGEGIDIENALSRNAKRKQVLFLFQGGFAPDRGLEALINAWSDVNELAWLLLRGPDNAYKETLMDLAKSLGLLDRSVFFPPAVSEDELVRVARDADVGIIPYEPVNLNYRYCSPNKLSQYMAAGLPIICNDLDFVKSIVLGNEIGSSIKFNDVKGLRATINSYVDSRRNIAAMSRRAYELYQTSFNWEAVSRDMYAQVYKLSERSLGSCHSNFDFSWIEAGREMNQLASNLGSDGLCFFPVGSRGPEVTVDLALGDVNGSQFSITSGVESDTFKSIVRDGLLRFRCFLWIKLSPRIRDSVRRLLGRSAR